MHVSRRNLLAAAGCACAVAVGIPTAAHAQSSSGRPANVIPPERPFAGLPFRRRDAKNVVFDNAWLTSPQEAEIVGPMHGALDFVGTYGTKVLSPFNGRAFASYQSYVLEDDWLNPVTGRRGYRMGGGLFVEAHSEDAIPGMAETDRYGAQIFHCEKINPAKVTWLPPVFNGYHDTGSEQVPTWYPAAVVRPQAEMWEIGTPVRRGDVIGYLGDTGVGHGWYDELDPDTGEIAERDREALPQWDGPSELGRIHFQAYGARNESLGKVFVFDPLDRYHQVSDYPGQQLDEMRPGPGSIFRRKGRQGRLLFADEEC